MPDRSLEPLRAGLRALHPADGLRFEIRSEIPLARGLGSSAAAIVAGLMAADHLFELGPRARRRSTRRAVELEGHPDNVAAALYGGFVVCPQADDGEPRASPVRLEPPQGVEGVLVIPDEEVPTDEARAAMPADVPVADAVANVAAAVPAGARHRALRPDADRPRPRRPPAPAAPRRASTRARWSWSPRPRSWARSGRRSPAPGPSLLLWCFWQDTGKVVDALRERVGGWAEVRRVPFTPLGADVPEL